MSESNTKSPILLLIDLQQILVEGPTSWGPRSTPNLTTSIPTLLSKFRSLDFPIIHIHHHSKDPEDPLHPSYTENIAPHPCSAPISSETILVKNTGSPFASTSLAKVLDGMEGKEREIVVVGMDGAECVNSTVRNGSDLGYRMVVVPDACASYGVRDWRTQEAIAPEDVHRIAMSMLGGYARIMGVEELLRELEGE